MKYLNNKKDENNETKNRRVIFLPVISILKYTLGKSLPKHLFYYEEEIMTYVNWQLDYNKIVMRKKHYYEI